MTKRSERSFQRTEKASSKQAIESPRRSTKFFHRVLLLLLN
jgi:hypothetical protein